MVLSTGFPRAPLGIESKIHWQTRILTHRKGGLSAFANRGGSVQSDCGVHGSLAQAGVPGLFPSNCPFQEITESTIHWAFIWLPFPSSKSGPKRNTRQPAGSQIRSSAGIPSFINPSMDDANSASTFPTPSLGPWLPLPLHPSLDNLASQLLRPLAA